MKHPFINDLSEKTIEELQMAIESLTNKLNYAYRTGNSPLIHQLQMVMESYREQISKKMDEIFKKQNIKTNVNIEKEGEIVNKNRT
jgi:hypothetical protein